MRFTSKHYFNFGKKLSGENVLINQEGWDTVRCDDNNTPFSIPSDEMTFVKKASTQYASESQDIINLAHKKGFTEIFSVGCGCGYLEYNIKHKSPELKIIATDFNHKSIERLGNVFKECDKVETFNMMTDSFKSDEKLLYLFFRIDTEITNKEWVSVFKRMHSDNTRYVLFVASEFLTFERFVKESIKGILRGLKGYTFCGYIRTKGSFERLWSDYYKIEESLKIGTLNAYLLKIND